MVKNTFGIAIFICSFLPFDLMLKIVNRVNNSGRFDKMFGLYKVRHNRGMNSGICADLTISHFFIYYLLSSLWHSDGLIQL